jgi:hypothetical protein
LASNVDTSSGIPSSSEDSDDVKTTSFSPVEVDYMGTVDVDSIEKSSDASALSLGDDTIAVPYLNPLG